MIFITVQVITLPESCETRTGYGRNNISVLSPMFTLHGWHNINFHYMLIFYLCIYLQHGKDGGQAVLTKLKCAAGLADLATKKYKSAAKYFLQANFDFCDFPEVISMHNHTRPLIFRPSMNWSPYIVIKELPKCFTPGRFVSLYCHTAQNY